MSSIWIDFENAPHVPFFLPIIRDMEERGITSILTARDFGQTVELIERAGLNARVIGGEYGSSTPRKTLGLTNRAWQLYRLLSKENITLALGHGSRGMLLASKLLNIRSLTLYDYEGASVRLFNTLSTYVMTPEAIPSATLQKLGLDPKKHLTYPGLKEEVYVSEFIPDVSIYKDLQLLPEKLIVTVRPPSDTAHYRSDRSQTLFVD